MSSDPFVHLHVHTHYSLLDGACRIKDLVAEAKAQGSSAVAMTDHGNMFGAIEFYQAAIKEGIKPIVGFEAYIAPGDRREKGNARRTKEASSHLVLLAMNLKGYQNLLKLTSTAYLDGYYYKPRIDREVLREYSEGLICTSACLAGEIPQALMRDDVVAAEEHARAYLDIFGPERFYIELQDHGMPEQHKTNPMMAELAQKLGIGLVAANDVHYIWKEDVEAHDALICINTGTLVSEEERFRFPSGEFYMKTPAEMNELFKDYPEACANTQRIADMCNLELNFDEQHAPVYKVPTDQTDDEYLRELVYKKAADKYPEINDELRERIDYELGVIASKGFSSYFLIVWDFVNYARSNGIPCGGRGSACSTVVGYCLDLSAPEPLRYGLYFERFMDPDRDEMPDIDMDICQVGREAVIDYVRDKYGHVAQIITYGTLKAKAAVKDVSRVLGLDFERAQMITKLIPDELKMTIDKALTQEPELARLCKEDDAINRVITISKRLEGLARHTGVHAAAVVVCDEPLDNYVPLYRQSGSELMMTQYDGTCAEMCGLLKMDFLGLRTLSVIERARQLAVKSTNTEINLDKMTFEDDSVYEMFRKGDTKGVFQFESSGMRDVLMKIKPNRLEDLIAANALFRPGPMAYIDDYVERKHGKEWTTPHPVMTDVLNETYGIMVYQEQVSRLVNRLGGIELKLAFRLAKAISKKKTAFIESMRGPFLDGSEANGVSREDAGQVFDDILEFGKYAFNKAHSTGYAQVAYKTAYLKRYYPTEYMAALLTFEMGTTEKVTDYIDECKRMGIKVAAPDINSSDRDFTVVPGPHNKSMIRFGLGAIKGVGDKAVGAITATRNEGGPFKSIFDFCERVDLSAVNRSVIEALIKCGAFDATGAMRKGLVLVMDKAIAQAASAAADRKSGQMSLFGSLPDSSVPAEPTIPNAQWTEAEMLAHEKAILGFYVTSHPLAAHEDAIGRYATASTKDLNEIPDGTQIVLGGLLTKMRTVVTKSGRKPGSKMGIITIEDLHGSIEAVLFPRDLDKFRHLLEVDSVIFLEGQVDRRREEPSLRTTDIITLDEADERLSTGVVLKLSSVGASDSLLEDVREVCHKFKGNRQLYMQITTHNNVKVTVVADGKVGISPSEAFTEAMAALIGRENVQIRGTGSNGRGSNGGPNGDAARNSRNHAGQGRLGAQSKSDEVCASIARNN